MHEEFINNMTNTTVESLIQKFAESKGTGKERPGKRVKLTEWEMLALKLEISISNKKSNLYLLMCYIFNMRSSS